MEAIAPLFPETYEISRQRFKEILNRIREYWPQWELSQKRLSFDENLTIDWIYTDGRKANKKVVMLTTGEHGIEGYVGSAMLQRFIDVHLQKLDPENTGLMLVHAINPWGMKHRRRVNHNNVDLNRNFVYDGEYHPSYNPGYERVSELLNPNRAIHHLRINKLRFHLDLVKLFLRQGINNFHSASLMGQYRHPKGMYYGGKDIQEETRTLIHLYRQVFSAYDQIIHLDMHTGYGPRYQMSIVNSALEKRSSHEFVEKYDYPLIVAANPEEFYAIRGDMIDFVYTLWQHEFSQQRMYSTSFEFGTLGNSYFGKVHCPVAMVLENELYWHGATNVRIETEVSHEFEELFNPQAIRWREKAIADADRAFFGILKAEGYIR